MATENRLLGWRDDAVDQLFLTFSVATSSVINTTFTANHTFSKAFLPQSESNSSIPNPKVMGAVAAKAGAGGVAVIANATSMSVYLRWLSPTAYTDENVTVYVTLEGGY